MLSNFGLLDEKRRSFGRTPIRDVFELGPVMFTQGLMLTASTCHERLTLAMGYCQGLISRNVIEGLLQRVDDELISLVPVSLTMPLRSALSLQW